MRGDLVQPVTNGKLRGAVPRVHVFAMYKRSLPDHLGRWSRNLPSKKGYLRTPYWLFAGLKSDHEASGHNKES